MKTLKGRPIGLNAKMTQEQMFNQLERNAQLWQQEGFSKEEITAAMIAKARPLINGYYWARYPDAQERCRQALEKFLRKYGLDATIGKAKRQGSKKIERPRDLLSQFRI